MFFWHLATDRLIPLELMTTTKFLLVCVLVLLCLIVLFSSYYYRRSKKLHREITDLQHDVSLANHSAIAMGKKILALEQQLKTLSSSKALITAVAQSSNHKNNQIVEGDRQFHHDDKQNLYKARDLLNQGISIHDVAKACQLSFAEVSLLQALDRPAENTDLVDS
ncbi:MAG: DUF2802 domain-containing protein [Cellvibrionaceae bacterium]|nr:DUF2802 domain-containing protein [Cellvibrionaceae bacterium]